MEATNIPSDIFPDFRTFDFYTENLQILKSSVFFPISNLKAGFFENGWMDFDNFGFKLKLSTFGSRILSEVRNFAFYYFYSKICTFYEISNSVES